MKNVIFEQIWVRSPVCLVNFTPKSYCAAKTGNTKTSLNTLCNPTGYFYIEVFMFKFGSRSLNNLVGVHPDLVKVAYKALELSSVDFTVIEGLRSIETQKQNVAKGVSKTMDSKHIKQSTGYGHAVDLFPVGGNWNDYKCWLPVLDAFYKAGKELGIKLRFGVSWTDNPNDKPAKFLDGPHVELA